MLLYALSIFLCYSTRATNAVEPFAKVDFSDRFATDNTAFELKDGAKILTAPDGVTEALRIDKDGPYALVPNVNINPSNMKDCTLTASLYLESVANKFGWVFGNEQSGYDRTILMHDYRFGGYLASAVGKPWRPWKENKAPLLKEWIHVAAVFRQGGESYVFMNGIRSDNTVSANNNNGLGELWIGRPIHRNQGVNAWIKEVKVFDKALSDEEVQEEANIFIESTKTASPTVSPTKNPTVSPTKNPTVSPTKNPTVSPTKNPTVSPTKSPTVSPTKNPTVSPTKNPTVSPTKNPTVSPTKSPTVSPTKNPTVSPTKNPTVSPTKNPTVSPTKNPTVSPTKNPTVSPTKNPTVSPTKNPTSSPTKNPTVSPTKSPTSSPTTKKYDGTYFIKSAHGTQIRIYPSNKVDMTVNKQSWEKITIVTAGNGQYALKSAAHGNRYLRVPGAGAYKTIDTQTYIGSWEKFIILPTDSGTVVFKSAKWGNYLRANKGNNVRLDTQTYIAAWEKYTLIPV